MAKQPTITTVGAGVQYDSATLDANFEAIRDQFDNTVSRDGSTPNTMLGDLDMNGYDIINVGDLDVATLTINNVDVTSSVTNPLNGLSPSAGDLLYWDGAAWALLSAGADGQVLKLASGLPTWGTDTDTDTVGVTIEEVDVSVQTNVTIINFITGGLGIVTDVGGGQVEVDLSAL